MGDSAIYVYGSYVFALLTLGGEVLFVLRRQRLGRPHERADTPGSEPQVPR
jgi:hypothetical protein